MATQQQAEKNREGFRRYYQENRDEYNARRRERYKQDKEMREKARERAREYRAANAPVERKLTRELNGRRVRVFSTGEIAQEIGITPQTLRNWEKADMIPPSIFPDAHRLYTKRQKSMIISLWQTIEANGGSWAAIKVRREVAKMHKRW